MHKLNSQISFQKNISENDIERHDLIQDGYLKDVVLTRI